MACTAGRRGGRGVRPPPDRSRRAVGVPDQRRAALDRRGDEARRAIPPRWHLRRRVDALRRAGARQRVRARGGRPGGAFPVMVAYSLGFAAPSLLVSLVPRRAARALSGGGRTAARLRRGFGVVLLGLGALVFTRRLDLLGSAVYAGELL